MDEEEKKVECYDREVKGGGITGRGGESVAWQ